MSNMRSSDNSLESDEPKYGRNRDALMDEKLEAIAADEELHELLGTRKKLHGIKISSDKRYLEIYGLRYRILKREVTDFSQPIVQIGAEGIGRESDQEIVILDPTSKHLKKIYNQVKQKILDQLNGRFNPSAVIHCAMVAVRDILQGLYLSDNERRDIIDDISRKFGEAKLDQTSIVPIQHFIDERMGACRHHGLLMAYVLHQLIHEPRPLLPPGNVFYQREDVGDGAHAWAVYKPLQAKPDEKGKYEFYLVDSMWAEKPVNVMHVRRSELSGYSEPVIRKLRNLYNRSDLESVAYCSLDESQKRKFIERLLNEKNPEVCVKFLNYQNKLDKNALHAILSDLEFESSPTIREIRKEINRVLNTKNLHKQKYASIVADKYGDTYDNKQQFIFGLLCKTTEERELILDKQRVEDLLSLKQELKIALFEEFESYTETLGYINILLNISSLHQKNYAEITNKRDQEQFIRGLLKFPEKQNEVLARQYDRDLNQLNAALNSSDYAGQTKDVSLLRQNIKEQFTTSNWFKRHKKEILIGTAGVLLAAGIAVATVFTLGAAGVIAGGVFGGFAAIGSGLVAGASAGVTAIGGTALTVSTGAAVGIGIGATALIGGPALIVATPPALGIVSLVVAAIMSPFVAVMRFAYKKGEAARENEKLVSKKTTEKSLTHSNDSMSRSISHIPTSSFNSVLTSTESNSVKSSYGSPPLNQLLDKEKTKERLEKGKRSQTTKKTASKRKTSPELKQSSETPTGSYRRPSPSRRGSDSE